MVCDNTNKTSIGTLTILKQRKIKTRKRSSKLIRTLFVSIWKTVCWRRTHTRKKKKEQSSTNAALKDKTYTFFYPYMMPCNSLIIVVSNDLIRRTTSNSFGKCLRCTGWSENGNNKRKEEKKAKRLFIYILICDMACLRVYQWLKRGQLWLFYQRWKLLML